MLSELKRLQKEVTSAAETVAPDDSDYDLLMKKQLKLSKHTEHLDRSFVDDMTQNLRAFSGTMDDLHTTSKTVSLSQQLLKSLYFPRITARQRKIPNAHARTFKWAYESHLPDGSQTIHLANWLKGQEGVFWIQGKPGSGKSTLMKFLAAHHRTLSCLQPWTGGSESALRDSFFGMLVQLCRNRKKVSCDPSFSKF